MSHVVFPRDRLEVKRDGLGNVISVKSVPAQGRNLDLRSEPREQVIEGGDRSQHERRERLLMGLLRDVAMLKGRWRPRVVEFLDVVTPTGGAIIRLAHGFGKVARGNQTVEHQPRILVSVPQWRSAVAPQAALEVLPAGDPTGIYLRSYAAGIATIRLEEGG